jgi:hypothetical protein
MLNKMVLSFLLISSFLFSAQEYNENYRYRKYVHVKEFYQLLSEETMKLALQYNMPPAAILTIASVESVESGYGRGYVAKITGNILSLGANKREKELPSLYLPNIISANTIIYNPKEIQQHKKSDLRWKQREKSLKKDYRPDKIAGSSQNLDYFDNHTNKKKKQI